MQTREKQKKRWFGWLFVKKGEKQQQTARNFDSQVTSQEATPSPVIDVKSLHNIDVDNQIKKSYFGFLSHMQMEGGDQCHALFQDLAFTGFGCWFDMQASELTPESMKLGVLNSQVYILFVTNGVWDRPFVHLEAQSAISANKTILAILETENNTKTWEEQVKYALSLKGNPWGSVIQRIQKPLLYHREGPARISMIQSMLAHGGVKITDDVKKKLVQLESRYKFQEDDVGQFDIAIFCNPENGIDQCRVIENEITNQGQAVATNPKNLDLISSETKVIGFITFGAFFDNSPVVTAMRMAKKKQAPFVLLQETDDRRGGLSGSKAVGILAKDAPKDLDALSVEWLQYQRRGDAYDAFLKTLMTKLNLSPCFLLTSSGAYLPKEFMSIPIEKARFYEPGTREWLFPQVVESVKTSQVVVILGSGGMGKSVFMAELARRYHKSLASTMGGGIPSSDLYIGAVHFFRVNTIFSNPARCLLSIATQLCGTVPGFSKGLNQTNIQSAGENLKVLIQVLLIDPANTVVMKNRCVVLIDALDECDKKDQFVSSLTSKWKEMPSWAVLVVSARPEENIEEATAKFNPKIIAPSAEENFTDLNVYFSTELRRLGVTHEVDEIRETLLKLSEGNFLWAQMQKLRMKELLDKGNLTLASIKEFPAGLKSLYLETFERLLEAFDGNKKLYKRILGIILAAREPLPLVLFMRALGYDSKKTGSVAKFEEEVRIPGSNLLLFSKEDQTVRAPHKSMSDWLTGSEENSAIGMGHKNLSVTILPEYHEAIGLACKKVVDDIVSCQDLYSQNKLGKTSPEERYALQHMVSHFLVVEEDDKSYQEIIAHEFLDLKRLYARVALIPCGVLNVIRDGLVAWDWELQPDVRLITQALALSNSGGSLERNPRELASQLSDRIGPEALSQGTSRLKDLHIATLNGFGDEEWDIIKSSRLKAGGRARSMLKFHSRWVVGVAFSPDGLVFCTISQDQLAIIWDSRRGTVLHVLEGHPHFVLTVCFSPDGKQVFTSSQNQGFLWNVETGKLIQRFDGTNHVGIITTSAFSPTNLQICTGSQSGGVAVWNSKTGGLVFTLVGHVDRMLSVAYSRDGKFICSCGKDKFAILWDAITGTKMFLLEHHVKDIVRAKFSPTNDIVCTISRDRQVILWNTNDGTILHTLVGHEGEVLSVDFCRSGTILCTGSKDNTAILWSVSTGELIHRLHGHEKDIISVAFSPDSNFICTGSMDKTALVWNVQTGAKVASLVGHSNAITCVAFCADGRTICSASEDTTAILWDLKIGKDLSKNETHRAEIYCARLESENIVLTGCYSQIAFLWDLETGKILGKKDEEEIIPPLTENLPPNCRTVHQESFNENSIGFTGEGNCRVCYFGKYAFVVDNLRNIHILRARTKQ